MAGKSESSMPMSRALAKLAVATDLGTAARPSTAVQLTCSATPTAGGVGVGISGNISVGNGSGGKAALTSTPGRSLPLKPSASRSVLASLPLPLPLSNVGGREGKKTAAVANRGNPPAVAAAAQPAASGVMLAVPSTPRLPPLPSHSPPLTTAAAAAAPPASSQLPPATSSATQQLTNYHMNLNSNSCSHLNLHQQQHAQSMPLPAPPLPQCGVIHLSSSPGPGGSANEFSKELRDAARNHPGLSASLLVQLHQPRRPGAPSSAPFAGMSSGSSPKAAAAALQPPSSAVSSPGVRPLSPRSRARFTASLVHGAPASATVAAAQQPQQQLPAPPPAAMAVMSPEALSVLLGTPPSQPPPTAGGLLVMRRAGPSAVGAGTALRPSTAQQNGSSGPQAVAMGTAPGTSSGTSRPTVVPHITVPYKPGSIRLPPGGVPGITAAVAPRGSGKGASGPGSATGSGTASPAVPATAAATAAAAALGQSPSELFRPWTSAGGGASGALRPVTANPLTHCMPMDLSTTLLVRVPRHPKTEAPDIGVPSNGVLVPPSRADSGSYPVARTASATATATAAGARPLAAGASVPGLAAEGSGVAVDGSGDKATQDARQLTAQELRAIVAALAASRPEAAAMLMPRTTTAASVSATGASDPHGRPASSAATRRATTSSAGFEANAAEAGAQVDLWDPGSLYGRSDGNSRTTSRATTRGSLVSSSLFSATIQNPSVYDDKWPRPTSSRGSRPASRGTATAGADEAPLNTAGGGGDGGSGGNGGGNSRGGSNDSRREAISAWGSTKRHLQSIPEDTELSGGEEASSDAAAAAGGGTAPMQVLHPLESLEPDPELEAAWASIVTSNQRPDTAATRAPSSGINLISRPATGAIRITRQAAPMVLVLEDLTASTPEVLERELDTLSLDELKALQAKLCA